MNAIILENDGEFKEVEYQAVDDVSALSKEEIMKRIQDPELKKCHVMEG